MKPCHYQVVGNHHRPYLTRPFDFNTNCYQCADDTGSCADTFFCWHAQLSAQYSALTTGIPGPNAGYCLGLFCVDLCFGGLGSLELPPGLQCKAFLFSRSLIIDR